MAALIFLKKVKCLRVAPLHQLTVLTDIPMSLIFILNTSVSHNMPLSDNPHGSIN